MTGILEEVLKNTSSKRSLGEETQAREREKIGGAEFDTIDESE